MDIMKRGKGTLDDDQDFEAGDRVMLKSPKEFYGNQLLEQRVFRKIIS